MEGPATPQDVENLVLSLYQPGISPQELVTTQRQLHQLQLSEHGWNIANSLLGSSHSTSRFFGALTFNIKLNSIQVPLTDSEQVGLEQSILHWMIANIGLKDWKTVTKLCSTLALLHLQNLGQLASSVQRLVAALHDQGSTKIEADEGLQDTSSSTTPEVSNPEAYRSLLIYITTLAEEAAKVVSTITPQRYAVLQEQYSQAINIITKVIQSALTESLTHAGNDLLLAQVRDCAVASLATTTSFYLSHGVQRQDTLQDLRNCLSASIKWCVVSQSEGAIEQLVEILSSSSRIFTVSEYTAVLALIRGPWGEENLAQLRDGYGSGDDNSYIALLLAYGDARLQDLLEESNDSAKATEAQYLLESMQTLLNCEGYPELEDTVIPRALEFWNTFVEVVEDGISEGNASTWLRFANEHVIRMAKQIRVKVCLPSWAEWESLSPEERGLLRDFRTDVRDLLESSYRIVGSPLVEFFVTEAVEASNKLEWHVAESALFCLVALEASTTDKNDNLFKALFESQLFTLVLTDDDPSQITRRTAIDLLGKSTTVFKRNTSYLPPALNFLFPSLQHPKSSDQASRSISSLCSVCRKELVSEIPVFLTQYEAFIALPTVSEFAIERVSGAIGALLQALPSLSQTIDGIEKLLSHVSRGLASAKELLSQGQVDQGSVIAGKSMRCMSSIAKSLQAPVADDDIVDVDAEDDQAVIGVDEETKEALRNLQTHIFSILSLAIEILGDDGEIIDDICNVFRAGFTEPQYSPFHFAPEIVVQFFSITTIETPRIESVLRMGCSFLRSLSATDDSAQASVAQLAQHVASLTQQLGDPRTDAEVAQSIIEMLTRFMPNHLQTLLQLQPVSQVETLFGLAINAIEVPEPLPKRSALTFWNTFLDVTHSADAEVKTAQDQVIAHYGLAFASAVARQIAGKASRVDLEFFANPLRKFLKRHVNAKGWFEAALLTEVPNDKADEAIKRRLIAQIGVVNTQRQTKELITSFWTHCQGMSQTYAPMKAIEV